MVRQVSYILPPDNIIHIFFFIVNGFSGLSWIKLLFSTWIDKLKRDINNFSLYLDYLDISICDRKICEVGHGKLDSLLYNTKHRGLVLSSYFNELCHEMGNTFFDGKLVFKEDVQNALTTGVRDTMEDIIASLISCGLFQIIYVFKKEKIDKIVKCQ